MKQLFLTVFLSILLLLGVSYADNNTTLDEETSQLHRSHHHAHTRLKSQITAPVDINKANVSDLSTLKGIGPKKAQAIIAYRETNGPFKSLDDLTHIKGIGKKSITRLKTNNPGRIVLGGVPSDPKKS